MDRKFFSYLTSQIYFNNLYGAYSPAQYDLDKNARFIAETRGPQNETRDRQHSPWSVLAAIGSLVKRTPAIPQSPLDDWVREGNSFLFTRKPLATLELYIGHEVSEENLFKSYGGDSLVVAHMNFITSRPREWQ